jgi:DNA-binding LacI/PurR family transcriptional regulator
MLSVVNRLPAEERDRLGLIGAGVAEYLDAIAPWLSYVEIPARAQGQVAIETLFASLDGAESPHGHDVALPLRLVERASTAPRTVLRTA